MMFKPAKVELIGKPKLLPSKGPAPPKGPSPPKPPPPKGASPLRPPVPKGPPRPIGKGPNLLPATANMRLIMTNIRTMNQDISKNRVVFAMMKIR